MSFHNYMKTVISGIKAWVKDAIVQPDLSVNDPTAADYVKNRTHWKETKTEIIIPETSIEIADVTQGAVSPFILEIQEGRTYEVTWNGNVYQCVAYIAEGLEIPYIGNGAAISAPGGNDEPFFITNYQGETLVLAEEAGTHTVSISSETVAWHTLDKRYLPANIATTDEVNNKMDATDPVGTGSFSMNRRDGTAVGYCSHAEGKDAVALGECSHAEGYWTSAHGSGSHAEGRGTEAYRANQHVQGEYNILDTTGSTVSKGKYAHIVGNGTSDNARSNAHTLDWDGNAWFAGDVYVGSTSGTNKDDGSKKLVAAPTDVAAGDLLMYDGTNWVKLSKTDLIAEIIAALPSAEEASF